MHYNHSAEHIQDIGFHIQKHLPVYETDREASLIHMHMWEQTNCSTFIVGSVAIETAVL